MSSRPERGIGLLIERSRRLHPPARHEGKTYPHEGEYLRLERPRMIEFTWISEATERQRREAFGDSAARAGIT
ncbi:MAG: hypothetical protein H0V43_00950, partial [Gemmatimonadales bacterium]|nr:hypothetical protein [Gemmatimonadales bacterium]